MKKVMQSVIFPAILLMGVTPVLSGCSGNAKENIKAKTTVDTEEKEQSIVETSPNIIYVFADQFRDESLPWNDSNVKAPYLERLASEGIVATRAYTVNPVCSPARGSMICGLYPHTHGVINNNIQLRTDITSIAHVCKDHGYSTGYIGKWHLDGDGKPGFVPPGPRRQGFDFWAGFNRGHEYWSSIYYRDEDKPIQVNGYEPDYQTDIAIDFIKENREQPFCLFMSWGPPHTPFYPQKKYKDERWDNLNTDEIKLRANVPPNHEKKAREEIAGYNVHITALDKNLGRLLDALDEYGLSENTIFVFTSDHGDMLGSQGLYRKGQPDEEAVHIPFIIKYPQKLAKGIRNDALLCTVDFVPTLLGLSGLPIPKEMQGKDISKALIKNDPKLGQDLVYLQGRMGENANNEFRTIRTQKYMLAVVINQKLGTLNITHLFDMEKDPLQMNNLAGNVQYSKLEQELLGKLIKHAKEVNDQRVISIVENK